MTTVLLYLVWGLIVAATGFGVIAVVLNAVRDEIDRQRARARRRTAYQRDRAERRRYAAGRRIGGGRSL